MTAPIFQFFTNPAVAKGIVFATLLATINPTSAEQLPKGTQPMTGVELYMLYRDRTWIWEDGAGRSEAQGRRFSAWAGSGNSATWAEGRWIVTDDGQLCLKADWHTSTGTYPDKTCFSHRHDRGTVYQKKEPSGAWYVFKHAVPAEGDEFNKLIPENQVSEKLDETRAALLNQAGSTGMVFVNTEIGRTTK